MVYIVFFPGIFKDALDVLCVLSAPFVHSYCTSSTFHNYFTFTFLQGILVNVVCVHCVLSFSTRGRH